jgi:antitoxin VapB
MILHVRDADTDELVRRLARSRGISITEAIREAVEQALAFDARSRGSLWARTSDLRAKVQSYEPSGLRADKDFYDELSGHED